MSGSILRNNKYLNHRSVVLIFEQRILHVLFLFFILLFSFYENYRTIEFAEYVEYFKTLWF